VAMIRRRPVFDAADYARTRAAEFAFATQVVEEVARGKEQSRRLEPSSALEQRPAGSVEPLSKGAYQGPIWIRRLYQPVGRDRPNGQGCPRAEDKRRREVMVGAVGFEPTISCSQSTCLAARPHPDGV
jgi:hypothetical protein